MKRVAALWLPNWSIDRILRAEPNLAPPPERATADPDLGALVETARSERMLQCDAPKNTGWRPGARWARSAREVVETQIAALPHHQRPPGRLLGRSSEAADHPFKAMPTDEVRAPAIKQGHLRTTYAAPAGAGVILVTTHKIGSRVEVASASPAARASGIMSGMALTQVRASLPHALIRDADAQGDADDLDKLARLIARRWTPLVAKSGADMLFLDLAGVAHLHGGEARMAQRLVRLLARSGFEAHVAIADTAGAAWGLVRYLAKPVFICAPGAQCDALNPLPAAALRLSDTSLSLFKRLGIETVGDVAALPRAPFARRFGQDAARRLDQAMGRVGEPLDAVVVHDAIQVERRFAEPVGSAEVIERILGDIVPELCEMLGKAGRGVRALLLVADRVDNTVQTLRIGLARPTRESAHILRLIVRRIEQIDPGFGIDAMYLRVFRSDPLGPQPFDQSLDRRTPDLGELVDLLSNRDIAMWRAAPIESDVPERCVTRVAPLDALVLATPRIRRDAVAQLDRRIVEHPWSPCRPRPVRLLRRPELIEHVIAELPDQPPRRFTWRGKRHDVTRADGPERITGEWWKRGSERDAVRDYFLVENSEGERFWLFRRGDGERAVTGDLSWYLHGRFA